MALLKIFSKLVILITVAYLPAAAQSSKMRTIAQRDTVASYFKSESIVDEVGKVLKVK